MDDVRCDFLGPPHDTIPAAVIANKMKVLFAMYVSKIGLNSTCEVGILRDDISCYSRVIHHHFCYTACIMSTQRA